jgi:hypothetical protein
MNMNKAVKENGIIPCEVSMTTIRAHYDGKSFVPDEPVTLPPNAAVTLHVDSDDSSVSPAIEERLKALADLENIAEEADVPKVDWSRDSIYSGTIDDPR